MGTSSSTVPYQWLSSVLVLCWSGFLDWHHVAPPPPRLSRLITGQPLLRALGLGALGVLVFGLTIPMTRLAVGSAALPQLSPGFVTFGRAALAGLLAAGYLLTVHAPWPSAAQWRALAGTMLGVVFGFPLCLALAVRHVPAGHAAVVTGLLPLATALLGAHWMGLRASRAAWVCLTMGCVLVLGYAAHQGDGQLQWADGLLVLAVLSAAAGYLMGTQLTQQLGAPRVISWALVLALPITVPLSLWAWPEAQALRAVQPLSWFGFGYVAVCSMWLGFFAWYRALAAGARLPGGLLKVSQVQLLQPFVSILGAVPLLGESLSVSTVAFALAVLATVAMGQRLRAAPQPPSGSHVVPIDLAIETAASTRTP